MVERRVLLGAGVTLLVFYLIVFPATVNFSVLSEEAPLVQGRSWTLTLGDVLVVSQVFWVGFGAALILLWLKRRFKG